MNSRLPITGAKLAVRVLRSNERLLKLVHPPHVGLQILGVLRVDSLQLSLGARLVEERSNEELGEPLEGAMQRRRRDVEADG